MLNQPDAEVVFDDETGRAVGVKTAAGTAKATLAVVGDPSYFPGRCLRSSRVVRATCILSHPLPGTGDVSSCQVIVPQKQVTPPRRSDIYVFCCSATHAVAPKGRWLAFVSTTVESSNPEAELLPGLALLGAIDAKFVEVVDVLEPEDSGSRSRAFV
jgi:Rab GDP dissociation inhibitor